VARQWPKLGPSSRRTSSALRSGRGPSKGRVSAAHLPPCYDFEATLTGPNQAVCLLQQQPAHSSPEAAPLEGEQCQSLGVASLALTRFQRAPLGLGGEEIFLHDCRNIRIMLRPLFGPQTETAWPNLAGQSKSSVLIKITADSFERNVHRRAADACKCMGEANYGDACKLFPQTVGGMNISASH